jgi:ABC-type antimicrobial peptide transport system permease subunit
VTSYGVSQRTREIGIQIAIGASPSGVVRSIVASGAKLALIGVGLGLVGAAGIARFLSGLLYGVAPTDPGTFAALAAVMALVTVAACYLPARRAAKLDPTLALRAE